VSESELKSKEVFDALLSKKSSMRNFAEEHQKTGSGSLQQPQDRKRASM